MNADRQLRILVVDDNHDAADSLAALLQILDYDVRVAYSGSRAIEIAGAYRPDVVILDMNMPEMDGLQAARRLKKDRRLACASFIAHTATDEPLIRRVAEQIGFDDFIVKGKLASLTEIVNRLLEVEPRRRHT